MFRAEIVNGKPVVLQCGELIEKGFNYLAEAQERADELNEEHGYEPTNNEQPTTNQNFRFVGKVEPIPS